jgi:hypothetical protein
MRFVAGSRRQKSLKETYVFDMAKFDFSGKGDPAVRAEENEAAWVKGMRKKVGEELAKKEIETLLYWKGELEKVLGRRPESLGTFHLEIQNFIQRMQNRVKVLKNSFPK